MILAGRYFEKAQGEDLDTKYISQYNYEFNGGQPQMITGLKYIQHTHMQEFIKKVMNF